MVFLIAFRIASGIDYLIAILIANPIAHLIAFRIASPIAHLIAFQIASPIAHLIDSFSDSQSDSLSDSIPHQKLGICKERKVLLSTGINLTSEDESVRVPSTTLIIYIVIIHIGIHS